MAKKRVIYLGILSNYPESDENYALLRESIKHASDYLNVKTIINLIDASNREAIIADDSDCYIVPGEHGDLNIRNKAFIIEKARDGQIPILGIGQEIVIHRVIEKSSDQKESSSITCLSEFMKTLYGSTNSTEVHKHGYKINPDYISLFGTRIDLNIAAVSTDNPNIIEVVQQRKYPFFMGCQFYPECNSTSESPHPLIIGLLQAYIKQTSYLDDPIEFNYEF